MAATFALRFTLPEPNPALPSFKRTKLALYLMTIVTITFRSEVALLVLGHCLLTLARSLESVPRAVAAIRHILLPSVLTATVAGLLLTVSIDTFMWRSERLLWPEAAAFLSNVFPKPGSQGASAWGTSPWHWYLTSALPRLTPTPLLITLPALLLFPTSIRRQLIPLFFPALVYLALYSILPHKETRFLFPIIPTLNTALALTANYLTTSLKLAPLIRRLISLTLFCTTVATLLTSHFILLPLSALTYPGGHALALLHTHASPDIRPGRQLHVHLTNLALQTGVTRFLEQPPLELPGAAGATPYVYDKSDNATGLYRRNAFWGRFDYIVVEDPGVVPAGADGEGGPDFEVVDRVLGLGRPRMVRAGETGNLDRDGESDGVALLLRRMYGDNIPGRAVVWLYERVKAVLTNGIVARLTGGRWIDWQHDTALVVMRRKPSKGATVDEETTKGARAVVAR